MTMEGKMTQSKMMYYQPMPCYSELAENLALTDLWRASQADLS
jgi:hypothetical protein